MSDVPTATIKHYLRAGLLPGPAKRTSRNMAYYDGRLAARVRAIKDLQKQRFLPLRVIAEVLEPAPSAQVRTDLDDVQRRQLGITEPMPDAVPARPSDPRVRTRDQVLESRPLTVEDLRHLQKLGLLESAAPDAVYRGAELEILQVVSDTRTRGLDEVLPLASLPAYAKAIRDLVDTELDSFRRRILGGAQLPDMSLAEITRQTIELSERLIVAMHNQLVTRELGALAEPEIRPDE